MKTKTQSKEAKFEESLERLESLVQEMESGNLPLEDILKKYEEGNGLIKLCAAKLNEAEQRIEVLMKERDGSVGLKPLELEDDDETDMDEGETEEEKSSNKKASSKDTDLF